MSQSCSRPWKGGFADPSKTVILKPGCHLTIQEFVAVARGDGKGNYARVELGGDWKDRCHKSRDYIAGAMKTVMEMWPKIKELESNPEAQIQYIREKTGADRLQALLIYGVLTGFGVNKNKPLQGPGEISQLQVNILRSHATGTGRPLPTEVVRGMMLLRARTFIEGHSGVRPEVVQLLVDMLNKKVHPWVPEQGSVGSSGDLCPLAHLFLVLIGEGYAWIDDSPSPATYTQDDKGNWDVRLERREEPLPARDALKQVGLKPLNKLEAKEGLAFTNGAALSAALAALAVYDAGILLGTANLCGALSLQAMLGFTRAFDPKVQKVRRHRGQEEVAQQVMEFAKGSRLLNRAADVHDPYSLRCIPQVHGAALAAIEHAWEIVENEINAVTDNPLFFVEEPPSYPEDPITCVWDAYSAGNFHGEPIGLVADYLKIAVAELADISERRIQMMLDANHNRGLISNLSPKRPGLNSGLMMAQYTAASLVSENKVIAHPASVDSIPTSSNAEDHVSMSPIAARHAREVVANTRNVLAIELLTALQALELRVNLPKRRQDLEKEKKEKGALSEPDKTDLELLKKLANTIGFEPQDSLENLLSPPARAVRKMLREKGVPFFEEDRQLWNLIATVSAQIASGELLKTALDNLSSKTI